MFCAITSVIVFPSVPMYSKWLKHLLVSQPVSFNIPRFEHFGFIPEFTNIYILEFSILRGVASCFWLNEIKSVCVLISVFKLLKVPIFSAFYD